LTYLIPKADQKLTPEEFSRLPLMVYEPEQFSDSDDEPPVVFLTPPESISRYGEKEMSIKPDTGYDEGRDIPELVSTTKEVIVNCILRKALLKLYSIRRQKMSTKNNTKRKLKRLTTKPKPKTLKLLRLKLLPKFNQSQ